MYQVPLLSDIKKLPKRFTAISTFTGAGGSCTGMKMAGGDVRCMNEFLQIAIDSYLPNHPDVKVMFGDIRDYTAEDFLGASGLMQGECDIMQGSPPCVGFSEGGIREKKWGKVTKYSETKQRIDDLFFEFARILKGVRPKVFIAENVRGLLVGEAKKLFGDINQESSLWDDSPTTILSSLEDCGYRVNYRVLNASDYGVPQNRERLFIMGVRNDLGISPVFPDPTVKSPITVAEALDDLELDEKELQMLYKDYEKYAWGGVLDLMPKNPTKYLPANRILTAQKRSKGEIDGTTKVGSYMSLYRICRNLPSPTIAQRSQQRSNAGLCHWEENRKLTIKELKRLTSYPDDYQFVGTFDQQAERIGRSVPPLLMKAVCDCVYDNILSKI